MTENKYKMQKILTQILSKDYVLADDGERPCEILATVHCNENRITIRTKLGKDNFQFINSNPETVARIANLLLEAAELVSLKLEMKT